MHDGDLGDAVDKLVIQMQRTLESHRDEGMISADSGASDADVDESDVSSAEDEELEFSVQEMRDELQRLMADLRLVQAADGKAVAANSTVSAAAAAVAAAAQLSSAAAGAAAGNAENTLCLLPAGVPQLPPGLWVTVSMKRLLALLQQPTSTSTSTSTLFQAGAPREVGFCGMGGIGKTVVSAWLARNTSIRSAFERILWVTFGQQPNIEKCQRLLFLQLVGEELPPGLPKEEVMELLRRGFCGKQCLLICDDVWDRDHFDNFNFIDDTTRSKVLISSRIRGCLGGGGIVDISLPSDLDSLQMLFNEAGSDLNPEHAPAEALEVVKFCGNLPLAVGMAGKLLKDLSLDDSDWSGVLAMLRSEVRWKQEPLSNQEESA